MNILPTDDVQPEDWMSVLGEPWGEYTKQIAEAIAAEGFAGRNDIIRPAFPRYAGEPGSRYMPGVSAFYRSDLYSRLAAYEMGRQSCVQNAVNGGTDQVGAESSGFAPVIQEARAIMAAPLTVFDHGCNFGALGLGTIEIAPPATATLYDHKIPARIVLSRAMGRIPDLRDRVIWCWVDPEGRRRVEAHGPYHIVISHEVLEHCADPVAELQWLVSLMWPGGILFLSTFFNSCGGHDPTHLDEHARFQDTELWFEVVRGCGLELHAKDPRGVEKFFRKEG